MLGSKMLFISTIPSILSVMLILVTDWCGIQYGRIYLDSAKAVVTQFGDRGTDLAYPANASFAHDINDAGVVIAYTQSDSTITPQCGVISVDDGMNWSSLQTVKTGIRQ